MNNDINSLNPSAKVTNSSVHSISRGIDENSNVHEGREYTDLTYSTSLEESSEKAYTVYQDFEDDFDFDHDIPFNLEGIDKIESLWEEAAQDLATAQEKEWKGIQSEEGGIQRVEEGIQLNKLGQQEVEQGTQHGQVGADQESVAVEIEHHASQELHVVQAATVEAVDKEVRTENRFNQSEKIAGLFGGFKNIFIEGKPLQNFHFLNKHLENDLIDKDQSELIIQLFDQLLKQGKLTKQLPTGEFVPLTDDEIEAFKLKFTTDLTTYFQQKYEYNVQLALDKKTDSNEEAKVSRSLVKEERQIERREKHAVREIDLDRHSDERHIQVSRDLNILSQIMIQLIVSSKLKEEIQEEKKEKELQDIVDSIKKTILMKEILQQEILKKEIDGTELKSRVDTIVSVPMYVQVKIDEVYRHVDHTPPIKSERATLPFPGLYKMKQMAASSA